MRRNLLFVVITVVVVAVVGLVVGFLVEQATMEPRTRLQGNVIPLVKDANLLGPTDPNQRLQLSISFKLRNEPELDMRLTAIANPNSPDYQHYITAGEFKQLYSPLPNQVQQVVAFLQSQGITINKISANNTLIDATCTVARAEKAFSVQINNYQFKSLHFYANANEPSVPTSISSLILSISGLSNAAKEHPEFEEDI
jgi:subtilase family serine protease